MSQENSIGFIDKMLLTKDGAKLANQGSDIKELLTHSFDTNLIYIKVFFTILIIIMAFGNGYTTYIRANIKSFCSETIIYGIVGALSILYLEKYRKSENHNYLKIFFGVFILYAGVNVLLELSGFYYFMYGHPSTTQSKKQQQSLTTDEKIINNTVYSVFFTFGIVLLYMILIMIIISFKIHDFNIESYSGHVSSSFTIELLVFSLLNSLPFFYIAYNRERENFNLKKNAIEVGLIFLKFVILHLMLQASGFYRETLGY